MLQVLDDIASTKVKNYKWEYGIGKNKMENLRNDTVGFSYSIKDNNSIERKIQAWCEGKGATVVKDNKNVRSLFISNTVNNNILDEYHQLVIDKIIGDS